MEQPVGLNTTQKKQVSTIQRNLHKQIFDSLTGTPFERSVLLSQSTSGTGAHLMQPSSEAYEAEDRCFRVSVARRLMLPHPAAANAAGVLQSCPNKSAAGLICNKPVVTAAPLLWMSVRWRGLIAGMRLWGDASYTHTVAPRYSLNRRYLLSLALFTVIVSMRAWILSSTSTAQSHTWMSPLLLLSLATRLWSQQPAPNQGHMAK